MAVGKMNPRYGLAYLPYGGEVGQPDQWVNIFFIKSISLLQVEFFYCSPPNPPGGWSCRVRGALFEANLWPLLGFDWAMLLIWWIFGRKSCLDLIGHPVQDTTIKHCWQITVNTYVKTWIYHIRIFNFFQSKIAHYHYHYHIKTLKVSNSETDYSKFKSY